MPSPVTAASSQEEEEEAPVRSTNRAGGCLYPCINLPQRTAISFLSISRIEKIRSGGQELRQLMDEVQRLGLDKLPNEVRLLFEKKQLDHVGRSADMWRTSRRAPRELRIIFTKEWSDHVDGVKLFERMNQISRLIRLGYAEGKVSLIIPKSRRQLEISIEALMESAQFQVNS